MAECRPKFVLFGDSITEQSFKPGGWGAALANTFSRKADVVVRGYGGYNTKWALFLLHRIFPLNSQPMVTRNPNINADNGSNKQSDSTNSGSTNDEDGWNTARRKGTKIEIKGKLKYFEPTKDEFGTFQIIDEDDYEESRQMWSNSIYVYMPGKRPYYVYFNAYIKRVWNPKGGWDVFSRENGFYLIKFELAEDCERILKGGPWFMDSKLIFMKKWEADLTFEKAMLNSYPDGTKPMVTTIFFGANDAALLGRTSERQHVPIEEYKDNLRKIVLHLKECSPTMLVVLITPPPVDEDGRKAYAISLYGEKAMKLPERTNETAGIYANQCVELAKELCIPCINLWDVMQECTGWQKKFLSDGLHLTPEGNAVVHREVVRTLENANIRAEEMPYDFPHHSKIQGQDIEKLFQLKK